MKKYISFISIFICVASFAQTATSWENIYGGVGNEHGYGVRSCLDQGYIVAGTTSGNGISDGYLLRVDSLGLTMWSKYYSGNNVDIFRSVKLLPDSGFIIAGYSNSGGNGGYDGWVMRTDKNGDSLWSKYIGTSDWDFFYDVDPTYDGGFVLAGGTYGVTNHDEDYYYVKIDANGDTLWTRTYGGAEQDEARAIIQTGDSLLAATGFSFSLGDSLGDSWLMRLNASGDTVWTRTAGYSTSEDMSWGICDNYLFGRIFFCGENKATPGNNKDAFFGAYYYTGANQFIYSTGGGMDEVFYGMTSRPNGTIAAVGVNHTVGAGNGDIYFFHNRDFWTSTNYGTFEFDVAYSVDVAHDDGYIACGYTEGFNSSAPDIFLVKIDTAGFTSGILNIREAPLKNSFGSSIVFPNPSTDQTSIIFDSYEPIKGELGLEIYDISGRCVRAFPSIAWSVNSAYNAVCKIDVSNLSEGIYHYIIHDASGGKSSGKIIVAH